ncbi:MAG: hypothetical protein U0353_07395 [Sandaracinus sp.]
MPSTPRAASRERALRAAFVCLGVGLAVLSVPLSMGNTGCATAPVLKGPGEPCTRASECESGLSCTSGICRSELDAGPSDAAIASDDASQPTDASAPDASAPGPDASADLDAR